MNKEEFEKNKNRLLQIMFNPTEEQKKEINELLKKLENGEFLDI